MWSTLARAIIRVYPRPWRERYADELLALVETSPPACRDLVDLFRGCVSEWVCDPSVREGLVLVAATTVVAMPAIVLGEWLHAEELMRTRSRWLTLLQSWLIWACFAAFFRQRRMFDWWRLRFHASTPATSPPWGWRLAMLIGTLPYFEFMGHHFAPHAPLWIFLIGSPAHLFVLLDRYAARPWFPHPGRINPGPVLPPPAA